MGKLGTQTIVPNITETTKVATLDVNFIFKCLSWLDFQMQEAAFVNDFCYRQRPYSTEKCGHNAVSIPADSVSPQSAAGNVQQAAYRYR